ncbi:MAG TPA: rhodanese-like domain-containing protein [Chitinophagaceae bacterium]|nr:rhodanese-like domain-containing protein [Chitinophagaceae bacterium]
MKTRIVSLLVLLSFSACTSIAQSSLPIDEFEKKINEKGAQILDVRTIGEYNSGYLKNSLQADWNNRSQFDDRTQYLDKSKPVYVYCASGVRSANAAAALKQKGFNAINMEGGMNAWKKAGKPVIGATDEGKISGEQYSKYTAQTGLVLIDFGAPWCPPCKKMEPVMAEVKKKALVTVQYVDGGANTDLMNQQKVEAMPTFILYKNGKEVWRKQGIVSLEEFEKVFKANA